MTFGKGDRIGPYTVTFPHGQGRRAETYRVKDAAGRTLFLKLIDCSRLSPWQVGDDGEITEIAVTRQCDHRNLCRYVDSGRVVVGGGARAYVVTGYVSGETLARRVARDGGLGVYEAKQAARHVLSALQHLHTLSRPVVHCGGTMDNVMLDLVGGWDDLRLTGLGGARYLDQAPAKPDLGAVNAFCLAPECFAGVWTVQSDIYAAGALLYQLIYEHLPWFVDVSRIDARERVDAILAERDKELDLPEIGKFELDDQLVACIAKALSCDAGERFQSAGAFIDALDGKVKVERQSTRRRVLSDAPSGKGGRPRPGKRSGPGFAAVAGMDELKSRLREEVIEPLRNPEEYRRYGVTIPNGMLLYGPPGCGKTFFAKHFAEEVGFNFVCVTPAALKSRYVNATQENIAAMFKQAEEQAPTIIFIDEINELVPDRRGDVHEMSRSAVNEMLAQMDRTGERGIFVIGATNYPEAIDPAMLRAGRLEKKYYVAARHALAGGPPPETEIRIS